MGARFGRNGMRAQEVGKTSVEKPSKSAGTFTATPRERGCYVQPALRLAVVLQICRMTCAIYSSARGLKSPGRSPSRMDRRCCPPRLRNHPEVNNRWSVLQSMMSAIWRKYIKHPLAASFSRTLFLHQKFSILRLRSFGALTRRTAARRTMPEA